MYDSQRQLVRMRWEARMARERAERKAEVSVVASGLLGELRAESRLPQPQLPLRRTVDKKVLADARLLMTLRMPERREESPPKTFVRTVRCGKCNECRKSDCGTCYNCQDKRRFGGQGIRKQACKMRRCVYARSESVVIETENT